MPRYFFHVDDGIFLRDETGTEFAGIPEVRAKAVTACGELLRDVDGEFWNSTSPLRMHVTDEAGHLLFTLHFHADVPSSDVLFIPAQEVN